MSRLRWVPLTTRDRREPRLFRGRRYRLAATSCRGGRHRRVPHWDHRPGKGEKGLVSSASLEFALPDPQSLASMGTFDVPGAPEHPPRAHLLGRGSRDRRAPRGYGRRGRRRQRIAARRTPSGAGSPHRRRPHSAPRLSLASVRDRQRPRGHPAASCATRPARPGDTWRCSELRARPRARPPAPAPAWKKALSRPRLAPLRSIPGKPAATARRRDSRGTHRARQPLLGSCRHSAETSRRASDRRRRA